jgi:hypothetical protein
MSGQPKWIVVAAAVVSACGSASSAPSGTYPDAPFATLSSEQNTLVIEVRTAPDQPPQRGVATVELLVKNAQGELQDGLEVMSTTWMPAMGHGSSVVPVASAKGNGKYVLDPVYLYMPGHWELPTTFSGSVTDRATPSFDVP